MRMCLVVVCLLLQSTLAFNFKELVVTPTLHTINVVTTYSIAYDRTVDNNLVTTSYASNAVQSTATITVTFSLQYTLSSSISCQVKVNNAGNYVVNPCLVSGNVVTLSNVFSVATIVTAVSLILTNVVNPSPAITTGEFGGTIGSDVAVSNDLNSIVTLTPAAFLSQSFTFSPNYVYRTESMIFTIKANNQIGASGTITLQFPFNRKWTNELSSTRLIPISASMPCTSISSNVQSAIQCSGDVSTMLVTVSNLFTDIIPAGTSFSFALLNIPAPPTKQPLDAIVVTSQIGGSSIDTGNAYVQGLVPTVIPSSQFILSTNTLAAPTVNTLFTLRISITTIDVMSQLDYFTIEFPTEVSINLASTTISSTVGINSASATYLNNVLTLPISGISTLSPQTMVITLSPVTAPPSTTPTGLFIFTVLRSTFPKSTSSNTLTAVSSTLSATVSPVSLLVNAVTNYVLTITTIDALTSSGMIQIVFPSAVSLANINPNCALLSGNNLTPSPICTTNTLKNSVTLSSINSSSNSIPAQQITVTISQLINPVSTATTTRFTISTYYLSTTSSLVSTGTINGITASPASIGSSLVVITASSYVTADSAVSYFIAVTIKNPIPVGGSIIINFPLGININTFVINNNCFVTINTGAAVSSPCSAVVTATHTAITFSDPFSTVGVLLNDVITLSIKNSGVNPISTQPVGPFSFFTYSSDGSLIAQMLNALTFVATVPTSFIINTYTRGSAQNGAITTYQLVLKQSQPYEAKDLLLVAFPNNVLLYPNCTCSLLSPATVLTCNPTSNNLVIVLPNAAITANTLLTISVTSIRNPLSLATAGILTVSSKTSTNAYSYSSSASTTILANTIPSLFSSIVYTYSPAQLGSTMSLQLQFTVSQSLLLPMSMQVTLPSYFIVDTTLSCNTFVDFVGTCASISSNTIRVNGTFTSSVMGFTVSGFRSSNYVSPTSIYTIVNTFDSNFMKIDESSTDIQFLLKCTMPCRSCSTLLPNVCTSCYSSTTVTSMIYFDALTSQCYAICPTGQWANPTTLLCTACDPNCLTCSTSAVFCLSCYPTSTYPYLSITNITQTCVSSCSIGYYPDKTLSIVTCKACKSPCVTCINQNACLSCISHTFYVSIQNACLAQCPADITVANTVTNNCDSCSSICLTCVGATNNCTACNAPLVFYINSCVNSCPLNMNLVPNNGICTPCSSNCKNCINSITYCTSCDTTTQFKYLFNNVCYSLCPETYYSNSVLGTCVSCSTLSIHCDNCSSASTCYTCNTGFVLYNSQCLSYVPIGYVNISGVAVKCVPDCATCSSLPTNCTACLTLNLLGNICTATCPPGFVALSNLCLACVSPCSTCDTAATNCTSCVPTLTPPMFLNGNTCTRSCPSLTYANVTNSQCSACISPCLTCTNAVLCLSCVSGYFLYSNTCNKDCSAGTVGINRVCETCADSCLLCENATTVCTFCKTGLYLLVSTASCLKSCGNGLYIDAIKQQCVGCTAPCATCVNSSTTCLSCLANSGSLLLNTCVVNCPDKMFSLASVCTSCPTTCAQCVSLTSCSSCIDTYVLYNGFCINKCPNTHAVVVDTVCTKCSTQFCFACSAADVCTTCLSGYSMHKSNCLSACPVGYQTNGTDCVEIIAQVLTSSGSSFPVPFAIAGAVVIIACLMSRLQFNSTYISGSIYSLIGVVQWGALLYFLYLYYNEAYADHSIPLLIGLSALAFLYLLNIIAAFVQSAFLCYDKPFTTWKENFALNRFFYYLTSIVSLCTSHKFRNILFCKLFTFGIFSAQLEDVSMFRIFNIFSLLSLVQNAGAIFAAATAISYVKVSGQTYYACIDIIVVSSLNAVMAFFNASKPKDFFHQQTSQGLYLHKKMICEDESINGMAAPAGVDAQIERGYFSVINHVLNSNQVIRFSQDFSQVGSSNSLSNIVDKHYDETAGQTEHVLNQHLHAVRAAQERRGRGFKRHNGGDTNTPFVNVFDHSAQGEETEVDYGQQEDVNGGEDIQDYGVEMDVGLNQVAPLRNRVSATQGDHRQEKVEIFDIHLTEQQHIRDEQVQADEILEEKVQTDQEIIEEKVVEENLATEDVDIANIEHQLPPILEQQQMYQMQQVRNIGDVRVVGNGQSQFSRLDCQNRQQTELVNDIDRQVDSPQVLLSDHNQVQASKVPVKTDGPREVSPQKVDQETQNYRLLKNKSRQNLADEESLSSKADNDRVQFQSRSVQAASLPHDNKSVYANEQWNLQQQQVTVVETQGPTSQPLPVVPQYNSEGIQCNKQCYLKYDQYNGQLKQSEPGLIFEQEMLSNINGQLQVQPLQDINVPIAGVKSYQEQLKRKIVEKEQELERIKVKIEDKERDNILKKNAIKGQQEQIKVGSLRVGRRKKSGVSEISSQQTSEAVENSTVVGIHNRNDSVDQNNSVQTRKIKVTYLVQNHDNEEIKSESRDGQLEEPEQPVKQFIRSKRLVKQDQQSIELYSDRENLTAERLEKMPVKRCNVLIDISQIDKEIKDQDQEIVQEGEGNNNQDFQERSVPMGIASRAKHSRRYENGSQDLSGMSETIEIMKPQREAKRVNEQIVQSLSRNATNITKRRQKMPVQPRLPKPTSNQKITVYSNEKEDNAPKRKNLSKEKDTLPSIGASQPIESRLAKRRQNNPLRSNTKWQDQHRGNSASADKDTNVVDNPMSKKPVARPVTSHLQIPAESDKEVTAFQLSLQKSRELTSISELRSTKHQPAERDTFNVKINSVELGQHQNSPERPQVGQFVMEDVDNEDNNSIAEYRKAMVLNQLNQRPANDDLRQYYKRNKRAKAAKNKNQRQSSSTLQAKEIYLQRLDNK